MQPVRRAVIDVGTNSIKLLVADVTGHEVRPVREESRQTRLGQGFYETKRLQPGPIAKTAEAVANFAQTAQMDGARSIRVLATSAARDAANPRELTDAIDKASGLTVEIISGEMEANLAFQGVSTDPILAREPLFVLDSGGGSTQMILGRAGRKDFSSSFALGTVRLLEKLPHSDPPRAAELADCRNWVAEFLEREARPGLERAMQRARAAEEGKGRIQFVGTGGTASILGCMEAQLDHFDRERLEAASLTVERLRWHTERLWALALEDRKRIVGLPANRADVILMGAVIFETAACVFGFGDLRVSTRGMRFAALLRDIEPPAV